MLGVGDDLVERHNRRVAADSMVESELVSLISFLTRAGPRLLEDLDGVVRAFAL